VSFFEKAWWTMIWALFAAFLILLAISRTIYPISDLVVGAPLVLAYTLFAIGCIIGQLELALIKHEARLQALCLGFSLKPFDWRLGNLSHLRRPGGAMWAFGPLRMAWRLNAPPAPNETCPVCAVATHFLNAGDE
jgi:hypothetical protein